MGDYYRTLGLGRDATKDEIKAAFRRCALEFHPDRHQQSSSAIRDNAALRFRRAFEAYEVLGDEVRRADYDRGGGARYPFGGGHGGTHYGNRGGGGGGSGYYRGGYGGAGSGAAQGGMGVEWEAVFRYLTSRRFALNLLLAGALLGGTVIIERTGETIWKMKNPGKSFEEAMEKIKAQKDNG